MECGFLDLVQRRQSTRAYLPKAVPREALDRCIEAARLAPSACNSQPWSFIVADTEPVRTRLANAAFAGPYALCSFAKTAPVIVAVVTGRMAFSARLGAFFRGIQYNLIDIGIACEHLVLQAESEGIGTCWLGWFDEKGVRKALGLPRSTRIDILISMGYAADPALREKTRKPLDEVRRYA
jgi:nitroreductase